MRALKKGKLTYMKNITLCLLWLSEAGKESEMPIPSSP